MKMFGIKNCDTVKKARRWLEAHHCDYQFHDFRSDGLNKEIILHWLDSVSWEQLLNKRSTTWRELEASSKSQLDQHSAVTLMLEHPTLIKRPVMEDSNGILIGFNESDFQARYGY